MNLKHRGDCGATGIERGDTEWLDYTCSNRRIRDVANNCASAGAVGTSEDIRLSGNNYHLAANHCSSAGGLVVKINNERIARRAGVRGETDGHDKTDRRRTYRVNPGSRAVD